MDYIILNSPFIMIILLLGLSFGLIDKKAKSKGILTVIGGFIIVVALVYSVIRGASFEEVSIVLLAISLVNLMYIIPKEDKNDI